MSELLVFAGIAFLTCVTPGAGVLYTVTSALRLGRGAFTAAPLGILIFQLSYARNK